MLLWISVLVRPLTKIEETILGEEKKKTAKAIKKSGRREQSVLKDRCDRRR